MTNFRLALAALTASQAAGCIIHTDDVGEVATIEARWSFRDLATQQDTGCPAGFDTVALRSQLVDDLGPIGPEVIDLFDCFDFGGFSAPLTPGVYETRLEVTDFSNTSLYAESLTALVDVFDADKRFAAEILNDGGYFSFTWDLVGDASGRTLACSDVPGLDAIESIATHVSTPSASASDQFTCADRGGVTGGFLQGAYTVSVTAIDGERALGEPITLSNETIRDRNRVTDLGHLVIPIAGR